MGDLTQFALPADNMTDANSGKSKGELFTPKHGGGKLKRWPKGVSGNPNGRPKSKPLSDAYSRALNELTADKIAKAMVAAAVKRDVRAAIELADRTEGKVTQAITGGDGGPMVIEIRVIGGKRE